jgi:glycosyltransferase involved in cell wall biosynthesis
MKKIRVLLIAELADPNMVSVPLVAWSHAQALRKVADVHIVTQIRHRKSFLEYGLVEEEDFTAIDSEAVAKTIHKFSNLVAGDNQGWTTKMAIKLPSYYYFEYKVWAQFKSLLKNGDFDIVHRLTPLSPTLPSIIAKKCFKNNIPFIWGPIAGGLPWPKLYNPERKKEKEWLSYIRDIYKLVPGYRSSRGCASALVIASKSTYDQLPVMYQSKAIYLPENAIDPSRFNTKRVPKVDGRLRLIFIGRLVPYKCADVVLKSVSKFLKEGIAILDILGDGPEMDNLKRIANDLGIEAHVNFRGNVEHKEVQNYLAASDVMVFPSIREFGGGVVLEAMAMGVVPIVVNYGGPPELLTKDTGITIELADKESLASSIEEHLEYLIKNPEKVLIFSKNAKERIYKKFTWDAKANMMLDVYKWVLDKKNSKPDFGMPLR